MRLHPYYTITSLPPLGELGSTPPLGLGEFLEYLGDDPTLRKLVGCLFLLGDLREREAYLAGELTDVAPAILSEKQIRDESPLPAYLSPKGRRKDRVRRSPEDLSVDWPSSAGEEEVSPSADAMWEAYFRHVAATAKRLRNMFLAAWVGHEVALRNALVSARAKRLGLDASDYLVATDLAEDEEQNATWLQEWENAATPLAGHRALIRARWVWLAEHDGYYSFRDDEVAAYALRLMLLRQWRDSMTDRIENRHAEGV